MGQDGVIGNAEIDRVLDTQIREGLLENRV